MFREQLELISEAVLEGSNRGIESFLETLNNDLKMDEIIEESGGVDELMKQLFVENGYSITELDDNAEILEEIEKGKLTEGVEAVNDLLEEDDLEGKIDNILESLKKEGLVD